MCVARKWNSRACRNSWFVCLQPTGRQNVCLFRNTSNNKINKAKCFHYREIKTLQISYNTDDPNDDADNTNNGIDDTNPNNDAVGHLAPLQQVFPAAVILPSLLGHTGVGPAGGGELEY